MTLETVLQVELETGSYAFSMKSIKIENGVWYFFIREKDPGQEVLHGKTLELVYNGNFTVVKEKAVYKSEDINANLINAVQQKLMEQKQLWLF